jgi:hypothetical protein
MADDNETAAPAHESIRNTIAKAVRQHGAAKVAREMGVSREAVLAYAGDFPRMAGTDAIIEARAARVEGLR